jgi:hypothetical protein
MRSPFLTPRWREMDSNPRSPRKPDNGFADCLVQPLRFLHFRERDRVIPNLTTPALRISDGRALGQNLKHRLRDFHYAGRFHRLTSGFGAGSGALRRD